MKETAMAGGRSVATFCFMVCATGSQRTRALFTSAFAASWQWRRNAKFIDRMKQRSMLHQETLSLLDHFARRAERGIVEIGAYVGGATAVIAKALQETGSAVPVISIEPGGAHDHPQIPSKDILRDLKATLASEGVSDRVQIIENKSRAPGTLSAVRAALSGRKVDLLVIDADGWVGKDVEHYAPLLCDGAIVVLDDYHCEGANVKENLVRDWVDGAVAQGLLRELGVFKWGTWFGTYCGAVRTAQGP
jgi:predicted O-methyltransferase YrrM